MNKNKIIFLIIWGILAIVMILWIINLRNDNKQTDKTWWDLSIWMVWWDKIVSTEIIKDFLDVYPNYWNKNIIIETFGTYDDYTYALMSSITAWKSPDIFVLNNNETNSVFSNQIVAVNPSKISPNDFRKKFKWFFSDDLIVQVEDQEYLEWIPVWYESLWIFYNRRYINDSDLSSLSWLNNVAAEIKEKFPDVVPIWIWNWSTVLNSSDIVTQFFMLEDWVKSLKDVTWTNLTNWLATYFMYWDRNWDNAYDSRYMELSNLWHNSIDLFSEWDTFMVVWFPSLINTIAEKWYSKGFLQATPFPHYYSWEGLSLVNYDYFVINKDSNEQELANDFFAYLASWLWAENYLEEFPYLLPGLLSLESEKLDEKIHKDFNIVLNDFYNDDYEFSSFDKWIKNLYDKNIISILDNAANYETPFEKLRANILCKAKKIATLEELSTNCEK